MAKRTKDKMRRLVSLTLAFAITLSMFSTGISGTAQAAQDASPQADESTETETLLKPTLFIDFLGDDSTKFTGHNPAIVAPGDKDYSVDQNPVGSPEAIWDRYSMPSEVGTVFWVGVGIDKMALFELAKEGKGLESLELGFYYNTKFVEPVTKLGGNSTYQQVLSAANLASNPNPINQWNSDYYAIQKALTGLAPLTDPDTRELFWQDYGNTWNEEDWSSTEKDWKMLYVSLEKTEDHLGNSQTNRFADIDAADADTKYIMMLPFRLKAIDSKQNICFRLSRDASLFSIGGGDYGAGVYSDDNTPSGFGAWEKSTRTPTHNLKEMFNFEGDLNIFTGKNVRPDLYKAVLLKDRTADDNRGNIVTMSDGYRSVDTRGLLINGTRELDNLSGGVIMNLHIDKASDVSGVTITVTPDGGTTTRPTVNRVPGSDTDYTFVMPSDNVTVTVYFDTVDRDEFDATLKIDDPDGAAGNTAEMAAWDMAADAVIAGKVTDMLNGVDKVEKIKVGEPVKVFVKGHPDYDAQVSVVRLSGGTPLPAGSISKTAVLTTDDTWEWEFAFDMPPSDVEVTVTYTKRDTYYAELSVMSDRPRSANNVATLWYTDYSADRTILAGTKEEVSLDGSVSGSVVTLGGNPSRIPEGRLVTLDVVCDTDYAAAEVWFSNLDNPSVPRRSLLANLVPNGTTASGLAQQTFSFPMPDYNVQVQVIFRKAGDYTLTLELDDNGQSANLADVSGEDSTGTINHTDMSATPKVDKIQVLSGKDIKLENISYALGYTITSIDYYSVEDDGTETFLYTDPGPTGGFTAGTVRTMPYYNLKMVLHFSNDNFRAVIVPSDPNGCVTVPSGGETGWWKDNTGFYDYVDNSVDELLEGRVTVNPGWYIASVTVVGDATGGAYTLLSNGGYGYNNGAGAGGSSGFAPVSFWLTQPSEDIHVYVELVEGIPPEEPNYSLTLKVKDPDQNNDNWAQIRTLDGAAVTGHGMVHDEESDVLKPTTTWQWVELHVNTANGYEVEDVVTPNTYGTTPQWVGENTLRICQPAGPIQIMLIYSEKDERDHAARLHINDTTLGSASLTNTDTSQTVTGDGVSTPIWSGDHLTVGVTANTGYKAVVTLTTGGQTTTLTAPYAFTAVPDDADVYVTFVEDSVELEDKHTLTLTAYGPDGVGAAGSAQITSGGLQTSTSNRAPSNGSAATALAAANERVQISIIPNSSYELDYVEWIRNGAVMPESSSKSGLDFRMPDEDLEVRVHFKAKSVNPRQYTANIVLRPPAGVLASAVGSAAFVKNGQYSTAADAGEKLDIRTNIANGYYISRVEVTPASLGITSNRTGDFGVQTIDFTMKDADCTVNIYLEQGWPPKTEFAATLHVNDPFYNAADSVNNQAELKDTTAPRDTRTTGPVYGDGVEKSIEAQADDKLEVLITPADSKYTIDSPKITNALTGQEVPGTLWSYANGKLKIDMPLYAIHIDVTFREKTPEDEHKATLIYTDKDPDAAVDAHGIATISSTTSGGAVLSTSTHRGSISPLYVLENTVNITLKPEKGYTYAVTVLSGGSPRTVSLPVLETDNGDGTYTYATSFDIQNEDAEVYVTFLQEPPEGEEWVTLTVTQTGANPPSYGSAELSNTRGGTTGAVVSTGVKTSVSAQPGEALTVTATPGNGYGVEYVELVDVNGNSDKRLLPDSISGGVYTYTLAMPSDPNMGPAVVNVVFCEAKTDLEAQLQVNNGGEPGNTAKFLPTSGGTLVNDRYITGLSSPADQVFLELTTMTGYVAKITVYPGGDPTGQDLKGKTSFYMPAKNVLVYVEFTPDPRERYKTTLNVSHAEGTAVDLNNSATLETTLNGVQGPVTDKMTLTGDSFAADPVKITIQRDKSKYWVEVIGIRTSDGAKLSDLTVDDNDDNLYTFWMPSSDVTVDVIFHSVDEPPEGQEVWFHLVGDPAGAHSVTDTTYVAEDSVRTNNTHTDNTYIEVKPNEPVYVSAQAETGYYIKAAYAMFGNAMLPLNLNSDGYDESGNLVQRDGTFRMQNGRVDVYVEMGDLEDKPDLLHYTAALTVEGPANDPGATQGAAGYATLEHTESDPSVDPATV